MSSESEFTPSQSAQRPEYLEHLHPAVREHFSGATNLPTFLASAGHLSADERKLIVRQALLLIEQNYSHLPLKRAMHSIDPVQRLKLLQQRLDLGGASAPADDRDFHRELTDIFTSLRDLHTNYLLPAPFKGTVAFLPFSIEQYFEHGQPKYVVAHVANGFTHPTFVVGAEVLYWNGVPIDRAVSNNGERYAGSNLAARHARGLQTLTARALVIAPPPDEEWVVIGYRTLQGDSAEARFDWQIASPPAASGDTGGSGTRAAAPSLGLDLEQHVVRQLRLELFAPQVIEEQARAEAMIVRGEALPPLASQLPDIFTAKSVTTPAGVFGYLRIWSFAHWPPREFVSEYLRLLAALPQNGLIIDVRGNGGGVIYNGELILQTLTPKRIEPEPLQFLNTPLNLALCQHNGPNSSWDNLSPWVESIQQSLQTGAVHSAGFPITDADACDSLAQKYFGPVVLITDALCYSTTDIFSAGFQDHGIGFILGTDAVTGAGGANVWEQRFFPSEVLPNSVYEALPQGTNMRVAIRRTLRVGPRAGAPLEDLGVVPDARYFMTRNDVLNANSDLINAAAVFLTSFPARKLSATVTATPSGASVAVTTAGISRLDFYVHDRPEASVNVINTPTIASLSSTERIEIRGFDGDVLVARFRPGANEIPNLPSFA